MKPIKIRLHKDTDITVEVLGDFHLGAVECRKKDLQNKIDEIAADDSRYFLIVGDVLDNATRTSVGDTFAAKMTPMQQIQQAVKMFRPISNKCLGIVSGNHEARSYKNDGVDLLYFFASELGLADRYDPTGLLVFLRFGHDRAKVDKDGNRRPVCYSIYLTHGSSGGRTKGGKVNGLERLADVIDADLICQGHTHDPIVFGKARFVCDPQNSSFYKQETVFVNATSWLGYEAYAERFGFAPPVERSPAAILSGSRHEIKVVM